MAVIQATTSSPIRRVNIRQDLLAIADLIEICFNNTLDDDGREYLRQLRWMARDMNYLSWLQGAAERISTPLYGFVWEEHGQIIGNLSLIPLNRNRRLVYLIANVAVHPDYRRRGIGRMLTQEALDHLRRRGIETAWLQVRDDNPVAHHLYLELGFVERARRTTWMSSRDVAIHRLAPSGIMIATRQAQDWDRQLAWLREIYPPEVRWNLPISFSRLNPHPVMQIMRWLRGESQKQWAALKNGEPIGFVSWEPIRSSSDALWLAVPASHEEEAISSLLPYAQAALTGRGRPLSVNYPAGRAQSAFLQSGFHYHQTLIWMTISLNSH